MSIIDSRMDETTLPSSSPASKPITEEIPIFTIQNSFMSKFTGQRSSEVLSIRHDLERNCCLCDVMSWLVSMCSLFGLFATSLNRSNCQMNHHWISKPSFINITWLIVISISSIILYIEVMKILPTVATNGTDLNTNGVVFFLQLISTLIIFICGNCRGQQFATAWNMLHKVVAAIGIKDLTQKKKRIYLIPIFLTHEFILNLCVIYITHSSIYSDIVLLFPYSEFLAVFVPGTLTCTYVVMLWIVGQEFDVIANEVMDTIGSSNSIMSLQKTSLDSFDIEVGTNQEKASARKIRRLRILHEDLCSVVESIEAAFGIQILVLFGTTSFAFVAGVYGFIVYGYGMIANVEHANLSIGYNWSNTYAGIRILCILGASQYVVNSALKPSRHLNQVESDSILLQSEVDRFLSKLGNFPVKVTCCQVFALGNSFLASAACHVVTYVLVLIQFRLDKSSNIQTTISNSSSDQTGS